MWREGKSFNLNVIQGQFLIKYIFLGIVISCVCKNLYVQKTQFYCTATKLKNIRKRRIEEGRKRLLWDHHH
jgi:hypothetical protein